MLIGLYDGGQLDFFTTELLLLVILFMYTYLFLFGRILVIFPRIAVGTNTTFGDCWDMTKGNTWRIFCINIIFGFSYFIITEFALTPIAIKAYEFGTEGQFLIILPPKIPRAVLRIGVWSPASSLSGGGRIPSRSFLAGGPGRSRRVNSTRAFLFNRSDRCFSRSRRFDSLVKASALKDNSGGKPIITVSP